MSHSDAYIEYNYVKKLIIQREIVLFNKAFKVH